MRLELKEHILWESRIIKQLYYDDYYYYYYYLSQVPNYYRIITNPMDFTTIKCKLARHHFNHYQSVEAFLDDCRLVFRNCLIYNSVSKHFYPKLGSLRKTTPLDFHHPVTSVQRVRVGLVLTQPLILMVKLTLKLTQTLTPLQLKSGL